MLQKITREPLNRFVAEIREGDKTSKVEMRYTVFQSERYLEYLESVAKLPEMKFDESQPFKLLIERVRRAPARLFELARIALNPEPDKEEWPLDRIKASFDLDHLDLFTACWVKNKVMNPEFDPKLDPQLAPPK